MLINAPLLGFNNQVRSVRSGRDPFDSISLAGVVGAGVLDSGKSEVEGGSTLIGTSDGGMSSYTAAEDLDYNVARYASLGAQNSFNVSR